MPAPSVGGRGGAGLPLLIFRPFLPLWERSQFSVGRLGGIYGRRHGEDPFARSAKNNIFALSLNKHLFMNHTKIDCL
jgi:hypothetical protein